MLQRKRRKKVAQEGVALRGKVSTATSEAKIKDALNTENQFNNLKHCETIQKINNFVSPLYKSNTKQKGKTQKIYKLKLE